MSAKRGPSPVLSWVDVVFVALGSGFGLHLGVRFWLWLAAWV